MDVCQLKWILIFLIDVIEIYRTSGQQLWPAWSTGQAYSLNQSPIHYPPWNPGIPQPPPSFLLGAKSSIQAPMAVRKSVTTQPSMPSGWSSHMPVTPRVLSLPKKLSPSLSRRMGILNPSRRTIKPAVDQQAPYALVDSLDASLPIRNSEPRLLAVDQPVARTIYEISDEADERQEKFGQASHDINIINKFLEGKVKEMKSSLPRTDRIYSSAKKIETFGTGTVANTFTRNSASKSTFNVPRASKQNFPNLIVHPMLLTDFEQAVSRDNLIRKLQNVSPKFIGSNTVTSSSGARLSKDPKDAIGIRKQSIINSRVDEPQYLMQSDAQTRNVDAREDPTTGGTIKSYERQEENKAFLKSEQEKDRGQDVGLETMKSAPRWASTETTTGLVQARHAATPRARHFTATDEQDMSENFDDDKEVSPQHKARSGGKSDFQHTAKPVATEVLLNPKPAVSLANQQVKAGSNLLSFKSPIYQPTEDESLCTCTETDGITSIAKRPVDSGANRCCKHGTLNGRPYTPPRNRGNEFSIAKDDHLKQEGVFQPGAITHKAAQGLDKGDEQESVSYHRKFQEKLDFASIPGSLNLDNRSTSKLGHTVLSALLGSEKSHRSAPNGKGTRPSPDTVRYMQEAPIDTKHDSEEVKKPRFPHAIEESHDLTRPVQIQSDVEAMHMGRMQSKMMTMYDILYTKGGNHIFELFSTGCQKEDCAMARGSIKVDGVELGGGVEGMNIVVLEYPGYDFRYSKAYNTGMDPVEAEKMAHFIEGLKSPSIVLVVSEGDGTSSMTEEAWNALVSLGAKEPFLKSAGSSFVFVGFKGKSVGPCVHQEQAKAGEGVSAKFIIIGSEGEVVTFGGSGPGMRDLVRDNGVERPDSGFADRTNENKPPESKESDKRNESACKKCGISRKLGNDESEHSIRANDLSPRTPTEAEADNEPLISNLKQEGFSMHNPETVAGVVPLSKHNVEHLQLRPNSHGELSSRLLHGVPLADVTNHKTIAEREEDSRRRATKEEVAIFSSLAHEKSRYETHAASVDKTIPDASHRISPAREEKPSLKDETSIRVNYRDDQNGLEINPKLIYQHLDGPNDAEEAQVNAYDDHHRMDYYTGEEQGHGDGHFIEHHPFIGHIVDTGHVVSPPPVSKVFVTNVDPHFQSMQQLYTPEIHEHALLDNHHDMDDSHFHGMDHPESIYDSHAHHDNEHHHVPVLNIPHPYVIHADTPTHVEHDDDSHHGHEEDYYQDHEHPGTGPAPMDKEFNEKFKALLAEELEKKLSTLKLAPAKLNPDQATDSQASEKPTTINAGKKKTNCPHNNCTTEDEELSQQVHEIGHKKFTSEEEFKVMVAKAIAEKLSLLKLSPVNSGDNPLLKNGDFKISIHVDGPPVTAEDVPPSKEMLHEHHLAIGHHHQDDDERKWQATAQHLLDNTTHADLQDVDSHFGYGISNHLTDEKTGENIEHSRKFNTSGHVGDDGNEHRDHNTLNEDRPHNERDSNFIKAHPQFVGKSRDDLDHVITITTGEEDAMNVHELDMQPSNKDKLGASKHGRHPEEFSPDGGNLKSSINGNNSKDSSTERFILSDDGPEFSSKSTHVSKQLREEDEGENYDVLKSGGKINDDTVAFTNRPTFNSTTKTSHDEVSLSLTNDKASLNRHPSDPQQSYDQGSSSVLTNHIFDRDSPSRNHERGKTSGSSNSNNVAINNSSSHPSATASIPNGDELYSFNPIIASFKSKATSSENSSKPITPDSAHSSEIRLQETQLPEAVSHTANEPARESETSEEHFVMSDSNKSDGGYDMDDGSKRLTDLLSAESTAALGNDSERQGDGCKATASPGSKRSSTSADCSKESVVTTKIPDAFESVTTTDSRELTASGEAHSDSRLQEQSSYTVDSGGNQESSTSGKTVAFATDVFQDGKNNVFDQGDYIHAAESLLTKDMHDAYRAASRILTGEDSRDRNIDARANVYYKRGSSKGSKLSIKARHPKKKTSKDSKAISRKLEESKFKWK